MMGNLRCPDCRGILNLSDDDWSCTVCESHASRRDLRPGRSRKVHLDMTVNLSVSPDQVLKDIPTSPPASSYSGPQAKRDSRQFMSVLQDALPRPADVLDLGCGPRDQAVPIAHLGHRYVGVDWSSDQADFLVDAHSLPFTDELFDCIFSYAVLEHLYNPFVAIREIDRVLKPGGIYMGTVSQGEPFHDSFFHHTAWGFISVIESVDRLAIKRLWATTDTLGSLSRMGRYPRPVRSMIGAVDKVNASMPFLAPRKMRWPEKAKQIDALHRAGSVAFVVQKAGVDYWR